MLTTKATALTRPLQSGPPEVHQSRQHRRDDTSPQDLQVPVFRPIQVVREPFFRGVKVVAHGNEASGRGAQNNGAIAGSRTRVPIDIDAQGNTYYGTETQNNGFIASEGVAWVVAAMLLAFTLFLVAVLLLLLRRI